MKKILIISAFPPNQKTAGQDYTRRLIIDLINKGNEVSLIYSEYPAHEVDLPDKVKIIKGFKPSLINCLKKISFHPFFTKRFSKNILQLIVDISKDYDILYFDFSQMHIYSNYIKHPCKIMMCHDVIAQKYTRSHKEQLFWIKKSEKKCLCTANMIITFSEKDCCFIKKTYNLESRYVNFYLKNPKFVYNNAEIQNNLFCFYGAWNRLENSEALVWFIHDVYPLITNNLHFVIIGGGMPGNLLEMLNKYKNISYLGFVDDPVIEISKCQALIAPLKKGAGVKVKVIDSLSCGTAVIGTAVAFEGITDNKIEKLFYKKQNAEEYIELLNNWKQITIATKQKAADEFFDRYDTNHFSDLSVLD